MAVPSVRKSIASIRELINSPPDTKDQAQIQLGLNDKFGAICAADDWDDANEEE